MDRHRPEMDPLVGAKDGLCHLAQQRREDRSQHPAVPAPKTSLDMTGPRGTSIPPPTRPQPRPRITERTSGLPEMNRKPSTNSEKERRKSMPPSPSTSTRSFRGSTNVEIITA